jgi:superfamily II DNA/RNA helicase
METLAQIHAALSAIGIASDHKLEKLVELLEGPLSGRKVLVFTEFKDTARYVYHQLKHKPYVAQIDSESARLGLERASRREVIERFAPRSNELPDPPRRERVELLIATDVLSEGLNLQDASVVVSYDLPWNPVRLMQRVGRVDRLGSQSDFIELYHFIPARALDQLLGLMSRLATKVSTIGTALGLDYPVLATPERRERTLEQIRALANDRDGYERLEADTEGPLDPEEQAYIDFAADLKAAGQTRISRPATSIVAADGAETPRAAAYWQVDTGHLNRALWLTCDLETGCVVEDQSEALEVFRAAKTRTAQRSSRRLLTTARRAFARYVDTVVARLEAARLAGDALRPNLPQCRIAAWLSQNYRADSHRLGDEDKATIDRLLSSLALRFTAAHERTLSEFAERLPNGLDRRLLEDLEVVLRSFENHGARKFVAREVATLLLLPKTSTRPAG